MDALAYVDRAVAAGEVTAAMGSLLRAQVYYTFDHDDLLRDSLERIDAAATADWTPDERERWYFLRGRELQDRGLTAEALALFEQGTALAGGGSEIEVARLDALHRLGRITGEELEAAFGARVARAPDDFVVEGARAEMYLHRRDCAAALRCAQRVLELLPGDTYGLHLMGKLCFLQGRGADAVEYFERACEANPENPERLRFLIALYSIQGDVDRVLHVSQFACERYPRHPEFHEKLAHALLLSTPKEPARALAHARQAHALAPTSGPIAIVLAFCLAAAGQWHECAAVARAIRSSGVPETTFDFAVLEEQIREHVADYRDTTS